jgi:hypothetical protein
MRLLELMTTEGCHLCEQATPLLIAGLDPQLFEVDLVDIAFEDQLMEKYATRIPVLVDSQSGAELDWPFDMQQLAAFVENLKTLT